MTENEGWAWLGGFMDGEGSFYPMLEKRPQNRCGFRIPTHMTVCNTNRDLLQKVIDIIGHGKMLVDRKEFEKENHKPTWKLVYAKMDVIKIVPKLLPYLVGKKIIAEKLLDLAKRTSGRAKRYSQEQWNEVIYLYNEIRRLNKRGTQKYTPTDPSIIRPANYYVSDKRCSVENCFDKHYAQGICRKHYRKRFEYGTKKERIERKLGKRR